ncbi:putative Na+/H+ antiporter [Puniceicoccaceae bacterium K14]|nr:putative Na+/H+ antiporter [Puniceicoccaceae bacterium K14]
MSFINSKKLSLVLFALAMLFGSANSFAAGGGGHDVDLNFPLNAEHYDEVESHHEEELGHELSLVEKLKIRAGEDPMNIIATVIFLLAISHTFVAGKFMNMAHKYEHEHAEKLKNGEIVWVGEKKPVSFKGTLFHFLGEVEAIFGLWLIPLMVCISFSKDWYTAKTYVATQNFTEAIVIVILMAIAGSKPIIQTAERGISMVASLGKKTPGAYWFAVLTVAPLLGSFITEPAAMTIAAILLGQQFYKYSPSNTLKYATIGILFVNVSVGGTLTHFAAPPVLMVAGTWGWDMPFMFSNYGWKAVIGILIANVIYFSLFKKEFARLTGEAKKAGEEKKEAYAPAWIAGVHGLFLVWTIVTLHEPPLIIGGFLFFLAFTMATNHHQEAIQLKSPILVGFFLAGLVTHGGLQGWWISPVLSALGELPLFIGSTVLTAFNDNAAITYLASQVPLFSEPESAGLRYAVVAGAVTGGGLTVIANAPNPAGQSLLSKYFEGGVSPLHLMLGALFPTVIMALCFMLLG